MRVWSTPAGRRLLIVAGGVLLALTLVVMVSAVVIRSMQPSSHVADGASGEPPVSPATTGGPPSDGLTSDQSSSVRRDLAALAAMPMPSPRTSAAYPAIAPVLGDQPDAYAAAFVRELFTRNYRTPRAELLSWIQSEAVASSEPSVVGLVPPTLRPKLAVYSLTSGDAPLSAPVPQPAEWARWRQVAGRTTVAIERVREPRSWTDAVAAGHTTDPSTTVRTIDARVTTVWTAHGKQKSSQHEVSLVLALDGPSGPPGRSGYGVVCAIDYHEVAVS